MPGAALKGEINHSKKDDIKVSVETLQKQMLVNVLTYLNTNECRLYIEIVKLVV